MGVYRLSFFQRGANIGSMLKESGSNTSIITNSLLGNLFEKHFQDVLTRYGFQVMKTLRGKYAYKYIDIIV